MYYFGFIFTYPVTIDKKSDACTLADAKAHCQCQSLGTGDDKDGYCVVKNKKKSACECSKRFTGDRCENRE